MHENRPPTVAVVVTCYNLGRFLDEAVDSVLAQTYDDFEIVIVDDGSTDVETVQLLAAYRRSKTRVIRSENRGLSAARNLGIRASRSPYVTTLDADDRFVPTMLEQSVRTLEGDPAIAFASHWLRTFGDEVWEWKPQRCDLGALADANTINGAALMRRECFEVVGGFDEEMRDGCEDWDFWLSAVEAGLRGTIIPDILYEYRRRPASMSREMMQDDRHAHIYAHIARKHPATFRHHLPELLARREREMVSFRVHLHDVEHEHTTWLLPEVARRRDDVALLERRARRGNSTETSAQVRAPDAALVAARRAALESPAACAHLQREIDELKRSGSWRITAPVRAVVDALRWLIGAKS